MTSFADKTFTPPELIRNFCIIAHIDHGKSTLADRMLQLTGVRRAAATCGRSTSTGWTSSASAASPSSRRTSGCPGPPGRRRRDHVLHLIDTPGHVDFTYEVSRSLAACEGAVLLVDAAQGIEAQTLANLYLALENDLHVIPVLNKIDLPAAQPERYAAEIAHIIGGEPDDVLRVPAKTGAGRQGAAGHGGRGSPAPGRRRQRAGPGDDLRLGLRHLPRRDHLHPGDRRPDHPARADPDDVHQGHPRAARGRRHLAGADADRRAWASARSAT